VPPRGTTLPWSARNAELAAWRHQVDVNEKDEFGRTALFTAALNDCVEAADALVNAGAKAAATDAEGCSAVHYACMAAPRSAGQAAARGRWRGHRRRRGTHARVRGCVTPLGS
jgi:hypothetical protein